MKKRKTLNEELDRMKGLMTYQNGNYKNPIIEQNKSNIVEPVKPICTTVGHLGSFPVSVTTGSGSFKSFLKAVSDKINETPELKKLSDSGVGLFVTKFSIKGGASNYYGGSVEPDVANDRKSSPPKGTYKHKKGSGSYKKNKQLAVDRATNVAKKLNGPGGLETLKIKFNDGVLQNAISNTEGVVVDTGGKIDRTRKTATYKNAGQIVQINMEICYKPKREVKNDCKEPEGGCPPETPIWLKEPDCKCVAKQKDCKEPEGGCPAETVWSKEDCKCIPKQNSNPNSGSTITGNTTIIETVTTCFDDAVIEVIYDGSNHACNHSIYEIYANGYKLKRIGRDNKLHDYASLNNKGVMDNAEIVASRDSSDMGRRNVFKLEIDGVNGEFFNKDIVGKHDGELVITAACKRSTKSNGRTLGAWPKKKGFDCHEGVGTIKLDIPSIDDRDEVQVTTPSKFDKVVKLHTFKACDMFKKHVTDNNPKVMKKVKGWYKNRQKKKGKKRFSKG